MRTIQIFPEILYGPDSRKFLCCVDKLVQFALLCKEDEREKIEASTKQVKDLRENVFCLKSKWLEAIVVRMLADVEKRMLPTLKRSLQQKIDMLNETIRGVFEEIKDFVVKGKCVAIQIQDRQRNTHQTSILSNFNYSISPTSRRCKPATYFSSKNGFFNARRDGFLSSRIFTDSVDSCDNPFKKI